MLFLLPLVAAGAQRCFLGSDLTYEDTMHVTITGSFGEDNTL